ncbi:MAG: 30S ribosomal protein S5 [Parcubacteria group bacterium]|nr:30S ribosomal protein S5 [Parcubacteria group bacterium]|tara:strand:- start:17121 stop:17684 length:564 start_codon:yes stop_codon:yes gene_type:complete
MADNKKTSKFGNDKRGGRVVDREFDQVIVDIARVTRVMAGGKRMRFRACVAIGDRKGRVAQAVAKGADVTLAVNKAVAKAKKVMITVPIVNGTIPHRVDIKLGAAKLLIKPAPKGTGIIAGGAVRTVLDLAGIADVVAKILGTNNKINNVKATIEALKRLKRVEKTPAQVKEEQKKVVETVEKTKSV